MNNRCAVVIGVSKTSGLAPLESPVPGARAIGALFAKNKYDIRIMTDEKGPVTAAQISDAINAFIDKRLTNGYRLLVVYFSGHGYWKNEGDLWLLSKAPTDAGEAVSLLECADLAQDSGIDNVVLVSDACRSTPVGKVANRVRGSLVFPNRDGIPGKRSKVDRLMASREGTAAYETEIATQGEPESVFTHCFLKAFDKPDPDMILPVTVDEEAIQVVPNRRLEKFLLREVQDVLAKVNITLSQEPVIDIVSDDNVYMARVGDQPVKPAPQPATMAVETQVELTPAAIAAAKAFEFDISADGIMLVPASSPTAGTAITTTRTLIRHAIDTSLGTRRPIKGEYLEEVRNAKTGRTKRDRQSSNSAFLTNLTDNLANGGLGPAACAVSEFESGVGFTITGAGIEGALLNGPNYGNNRFDLVQRGSKDELGIIRIWLEHRSIASMLLVLDNGRGVPLAVLQGYIGHIVVRDGLVQNINYIPINPSHGQSVKPWRWSLYVANAPQLERLRAIAAAAVAGNGFRIGNPDRANRVAEVLRDAKGIDPMLGLFATYAYLEAGHDQQIDSVRQYMSEDLDAELFDVAMLSKSRTSDVLGLAPQAPFCPILTQGWNYLRSRRVSLSKAVAEGQDELVPGPFTTFKPSYAKTLFYAISRGDLERT